MSVVITGNPGVGKHTITEKIAERMKLSIIDINRIAEDSELFEKNNDTNDVDIGELEKILEQKISKKNVIVGHLAPYVLKKEQVKMMIVLRRNPYDLISVYKDRKYSEKKIIENAGSEVLGIIANDAINEFEGKVFQIDISKKTISEVVENTMKIITTEKGNEEVDWLELVKENNDLDKFFVD